MSPKEQIKGFYTCFANRDATGMTRMYHPDVVFNDPVFTDLNHKEVCAMWEMLITRGGEDLKISLLETSREEDGIKAVWEATYRFGRKRRKVINRIEAKFEFKDNLIIRHRDEFDFWKWSRMALGGTGVLLGWSTFLKKKVQDTARKGLKKWMEK